MTGLARRLGTGKARATAKRRLPFDDRGGPSAPEVEEEDEDEDCSSEEEEEPVGDVVRTPSR